MSSILSVQQNMLGQMEHAKNLIQNPVASLRLCSIKLPWEA